MTRGGPPRPPVFLSAEWRNLVMLSYEIEPAILAPHVPRGCELDAWAGRTFVSVVAFQFLRTRVAGIPVPFHRHFDEVNLRFYVRRRAADGWRRGVVFVKELVPRRAIALVARALYGENYVAVPMRHSIVAADGSTTLAYEWWRGARWEGVSAIVSGAPSLPPDDAEETFITEHYWGYSRQASGATLEYQVEHPRWRVWRATRPALSCDVASLYGPPFTSALSSPPRTAFVADGSRVVVRRPVAL